MPALRWLISNTEVDVASRILEQDGLTIDVHGTASDVYKALLGSVVFGTGGLKYRRLNVDAQIARLGPSYFFEAHRDGRLAGIYAHTPVDLDVDGTTIRSVYRSQLCVAEDARRQGVASALRRASSDWLEDYARGKPLVSWGCVEQSNAATRGLLTRDGGLKLGRLTSRLCYRQWPSRPKTVASLRDQPLSGLAFSSQAAHSMQADDVQLELLDYGTAARLLNNYLFRYVPPARRRFNPACFRYARLRLPPVVHGNFEGLIQREMCRLETHYAVVVADPATPLGRAALGRFVLTTELCVIGMLVNGDQTLLERIRSHPLLIAPLDV